MEWVANRHVLQIKREEGRLALKYRLYHYTLSPFCRKLRLVLSEKKVEFELIEEKYWEKRPEFLRISPAGKVPVLWGKSKETGQSKVFSDSLATCEYIDEIHPEPPLMPTERLERYETRRLINWFDEKFYQEVTSKLVGERVLRRLQDLGPPDAANIATGRRNLHFHLEYTTYLLDNRRWIAGNSMTLADFAAAAHISCLDFIHDIDWNELPTIQAWYSAMKSRPAFQPLLSEFIPYVRPPPDWYSDLDFGEHD